MRKKKQMYQELSWDAYDDDKEFDPFTSPYYTPARLIKALQSYPLQQLVEVRELYLEKIEKVKAGIVKKEILITSLEELKSMVHKRWTNGKEYFQLLTELLEKVKAV